MIYTEAIKLKPGDRFSIPGEGLSNKMCLTAIKRNRREDFCLDDMGKKIPLRDGDGEIVIEVKGDKKVPVYKKEPTEMIVGAAIVERRDGKLEVITKTVRGDSMIEFRFPAGENDMLKMSAGNKTVDIEPLIDKDSFENV